MYRSHRPLQHICVEDDVLDVPLSSFPLQHEQTSAVWRDIHVEVGARAAEYRLAVRSIAAVESVLFTLSLSSDIRPP